MQNEKIPTLTITDGHITTVEDLGKFHRFSVRLEDGAEPTAVETDLYGEEKPLFQWLIYGPNKVDNSVAVRCDAHGNIVEVFVAPGIRVETDENHASEWQLERDGK